MRLERLEILIQSMGLVHMCQRFRPGQRGAFPLAEMLAHAPAREAVQLGVRHAAGAQRFRMHLQAKSAAIDLRHSQPDQLDQRLAKTALFQSLLGGGESLVGVGREGPVGQTKGAHGGSPVKKEGWKTRPHSWPAESTTAGRNASPWPPGPDESRTVGPEHSP